MTILATLAGIVLPALVVAMAVRRWFAELPWRFPLLFLGMTLLYLHGAVFTSDLPVPVDEVARGYPFKGVVGEVSPKNPLTNDTVKLFLPWMQVAREELFHFRAPLWNRYAFAGYPLLANGESAPFSPLFLSTLFVPLPKQIVAMAGLKVFLALLFGYLLARREGLSSAASCFVSTAFAWSVFQTVFLYYSTTAVTALLPAAIFAVLEAQRRTDRRTLLLVACVVATLMANGHPESVLHIAIATAGFLAIDFAGSKEKRAWLLAFRWPAAGALLGLVFSLPAWVPVLEQVLLSTRLAELRGGAGHVSTYPWTAAWAMVMPNGFGNPVRHNWSWIFNYSLVASSYLGLPLLVLAMAAIASKRTLSRHRWLLLFAVALWVLALGWGPIGRAANAVPPFSITANDKLRFAAVLLSAIAAGGYLDALPLRRSRLLAFPAIATCLLAIYAWIVCRPRTTSADLLGVLAVTIVVAVAYAAPRWTATAAFVALAVELFALNAGFNALVEARYFRPALPMVTAIRERAGSEPFRIAGLEWALVPNAAGQYGLEDIRGSDPMSYAAYTRMLGPIVRDDRSIDFDRLVQPDHPLLDLLNVRYLLTEPGVDPGGRWRRIYRGDDGNVFENPSARPRFWVDEGDGDATVEDLGGGRYRVGVEARTAVRVMASVVAAPGWTASIGRRPVPLQQSQGFWSFRLEPGVHLVCMDYDPLSFRLTWPVSLLSLAAGLAWCVFPKRAE